MAIASVGKTATVTSQPASTNTSAMAVVTTLFFMWGFLTCLNDILIPHLRAIFDLNYAEGMLVQLAFFLSYAVFALPSGKLVEWIGYKQSMVVGLLTMGVGALLFMRECASWAISWCRGDLFIGWVFFYVWECVVWY